MSENAMITEAAVDSKVATSSEGGKPSFVECHVFQQQGKIYVRDYAEAGPAFVLMHGLPDSACIYGDLIPYLVAAGRRVVAFDFLGFGNSEKRPGATYSFKQQIEDLHAVVAELRLRRIVPVSHDSSGPAALNYSIEHPEHVDSVCILNSVYARHPLFDTRSQSSCSQTGTDQLLQEIEHD